MERHRHDAIFMEILQDNKSILGFLDSVFGFLSRKTDFYYEMTNEKDKIGFPPGMKEKVTMNILRKYDPKYRKYFNADDADSKVEDSKCENNPETKEKILETRPVNSKTESPSDISKEFVKFQPNEYYNGAAFENYCWSQTYTELEIYILLPPYITKSKQLNVVIQPNSIKIQDNTNNEIIFGGELSNKCRNSEVVWSISGGRLQMTLDKVKETWWDKLLKTEQKLDVNQLDCTRSIEELPDDSRAAIEKLQWDQRRKMMGLPTSDDLQKRELLKKAWDLEGSPFKGQPFDPSIVQFQ